MKQVKKILAIFLSSLFATAALTSCKKDLGNYDYKDVNKLKITTDMSQVDPNVFITADSIVLNQNDSLKVKLKIAQSLGTAENFKFQWMITQASATLANPSKYVIDSTAALATKITLVPNLYRLVAKVTDKTSGVSYYKYFALNVSSAPWGNEGWLILQDQPDGADVSVITSRDGVSRGNVYHDVYSIYNHHKLPSGTNKVNVINFNASQRLQKVSFLYPNGGLEVRGIDFADSTKVENWFGGVTSGLNIQLNGSTGISWEYLINNNQISYRQVTQSLLKLYTTLNFSPPFLGTFTLSPFVINASSGSEYFLLFDSSNRCFLQVNPAGNGSFVPSAIDKPNQHFPTYYAALTVAGSNPTLVAAALNPTTGSGFDLNNMQHNLVYAENTQSKTDATPYWNCFFRNDAGTTTYLIQLQHKGAGLTNNNTTGRFTLDNTKCPGINAATMFACATKMTTPGVFYYVNGSNIYACSVKTLANSTAQVTGIPTQPTGYAFPAGTIIRAMKTFNSGYTTANNTALSVPDGKVLVVATDETASGGGHKVYFLKLTTNGSIDPSPAQVYTGFNKINDIAFKKALGN